MLSDLDLFICLVYGLSLLAIGILSSRKNVSVAQFITANQTLPSWVISLSVFATFVSSISYIGLPGSSFKGNWNSFVFSLSIPIAALLTVYYFVPFFRKLNTTSAYSFLENRFGNWARSYAASMYLLTQIVRSGTILYLMALIPGIFFGWDLMWVIILTSLIVLFYSSIGGISAVIWTDALQAIILIGGALLSLYFIINQTPGGLSEIITVGLNENKFSLGSFSLVLGEPTFWVVFFYGLFINLQNFGADQNYIQRYFAARSLTAAKRSALWGAMIYIPVSLLFLMIGTSLYVRYQHTNVLNNFQEADKVFPYFIATELPNGFKGILIASIFSAGMSTISTSYNGAATILLKDFYERYFNLKAESTKIFLLHFSSAIIAFSATGVALLMITSKNILDTWWKLASVFSGGMLGLMLLGMFNNSMSRMNVLIAVCSGIVVILSLTISNFYFPDSWLGMNIHPYLSIVIGTIAIFAVGWGTSKYSLSKDQKKNHV